eukprot:UN12289
MKTLCGISRICWWVLLAWVLLPLETDNIYLMAVWTIKLCFDFFLYCLAWGFSVLWDRNKSVCAVCHVLQYGI